MNGVQHDLWRAVDQHGVVIDILVQPKRDRRAAILFFRKLLRTTKRKPRVIITDKLRSYGAAKKVVLPRERRMRRFKSPEQAQRFLEIHDLVAPHFRPQRHLLSAANYRVEREQRFQIWHKITTV